MKSIGRRLSVLLIDDEPLVRIATAEMIRDLGHHVEEAGGGAEGLARLEDGLLVDVVITDYMMPGMDGGALSRRIAQTQPRVPVLLITGYTGPTDDVLHLPRLAKPFGQAEIADALGKSFCGRRKGRTFPGSQAGQIAEPGQRSDQKSMPPIPPMPPPPIGIAGLSSGSSAMAASVVIRRPAIDAASWRAARTTLVGSITPALTRFS